MSSSNSEVHEILKKTHTTQQELKTFLEQENITDVNTINDINMIFQSTIHTQQILQTFLEKIFLETLNKTH